MLYITMIEQKMQTATTIPIIRTVVSPKEPIAAPNPPDVSDGMIVVEFEVDDGVTFEVGVGFEIVRVDGVGVDGGDGVGGVGVGVIFGVDGVGFGVVGVGGVEVVGFEVVGVGGAGVGGDGVGGVGGGVGGG